MSASTEGLGATAGGSPYTASKHGVIGLTRSLAVELGKLLIAADRGIIDEDLRHGPASTCALHHLNAELVIGAHVNLLEFETLSGDELLTLVTPPPVQAVR